jgi:methylglutaconyl-CoA hydratase
VKTNYKYIEVYTDGPIAKITLNRPDRHNALILEMISELELILDEVALDDSIHFVILEGKGRSFCAGADVNWFYSSEQLTVEQNTDAIYTSPAFCRNFTSFRR